MAYELGTTEAYSVIAVKTKVAAGGDQAEAIKANFDLLAAEFPKLKLTQMGPVHILYHHKKGFGAGDCEIETAYPILPGKAINMPKGSRMESKQLKRARCAVRLHRGPAWETPWADFVAETKAAGAVAKAKDLREVYRVFKGGDSPENEIEMQILLE